MFSRLMDPVEIAKKCAMHSEMRYKHGAVILHEGRIISYGWNRSIKGKSGTGAAVGPAANSFHAEVDALCRLQKRYRPMLPRCTMVVVRVNDRDCLKNSKPCENCRRTIMEARVGKTLYTT